MDDERQKSLVIGFCKCAKCGWTDNKFNWHTYFVCPECGSRDYTKWLQDLEEKNGYDNTDTKN